MEKELFGAMQGWQCPICKRVYSPFTQMCLYCGKKEIRTNIGSCIEEQSSDFRNQTTI